MELFYRERYDRDMNMGDEFAIGFDTEEVIEGWLIIEMERFNILKRIEVSSRNNSFGGDVERNNARLSAKRKVTRYTNEDEGDGHERTVGVECPSDNSDEEERDNDSGFWSQFKWLVLRRLPIKQNLSVRW